MINKILAPLDGSELDACVLPHVVAIAQAMDASITLLRVLESQEVQAGIINPLAWQLYKMEAQSALATIGARVSQGQEPLPTLTLLEGRTAESIIDYAQKDNFDLVVLNSHGHGDLSGSNVSDVAQTVVARAGKSILLVRANQACQASEPSAWHHFRYRRILVALDGSPRAESILPVASVLAQHQGAELILAHVVARPEMMPYMPLTAAETAMLDQIVERNQKQAVQYFAKLQARLLPTPQLYLEVNHHVPARLHKLVEQVKADLVILCAHGASVQPQWPYGNVTTNFIAYGTTPLLILQDLTLQDMANAVHSV
ncbi:hypothetical protein BH10CHL1_BH10CHL1_48600 [soil metagenome]